MALKEETKVQLLEILQVELNELVEEVKSGDIDLEDVAHSLIDIAGGVLAMIVPGKLDDAVIMGVALQTKSMVTDLLLREADELLQKAEDKDEKADEIEACLENPVEELSGRRERKLQRRLQRLRNRASDLREEAADIQMDVEDDTILVEE